MPIQAGQSIGRYQIIEQLGQGGMARVYRAYDTRLKKDVAVKVIRREAFSPEVVERMLARFDQEAVSLARLTHPNIIAIIDYDRFEDTSYLVMPYISGGTLKERIGKLETSRQTMPLAEAARLLAPIARALDYAHRHEILHRDVKPGNILITESGEPMLTDFGIARILDADGTTLTGTGVGVGTPEYMAPEQWLGRPEPASDQYGLGIILYELLTGRKPYSADTPPGVMLKHVTEELPRPRQFAPDLPEAAEKVLYTALAKKPEKRYPSMAAFAAALEALSVPERQPPAAGRSKPAPFDPQATYDQVAGTPPRLNARRRGSGQVVNLPVMRIVTIVAVVGGLALGMWQGLPLVRALGTRGETITPAAPPSAATETVAPATPIPAAALPPSETPPPPTQTSAPTDTPETTLTAWPTNTPAQSPTSASTSTPAATATAVAAPTTSSASLISQENLAKLQPVFTWKTADSPILASAIDASGRRLAVGSANGSLYLYDLGQGQELYQYHNKTLQPVISLSFSPGGNQVGAVFQDGTIYLWDLQSQAEIPPVAADGRLVAVDFTAEQRLQVLDTDGMLWNWDLEQNTRTQVRDLTSGAIPVRQAAFSPDHDRIVLITLENVRESQVKPCPNSDWKGNTYPFFYANQIISLRQVSDEKVSLDVHNSVQWGLGGTFANAVAFAPDRSRFYFGYARQDLLVQSYNIDQNSSVEFKLLSAASSVTTLRCYNAALANDWEDIAYQHQVFMDVQSLSLTADGAVMAIPMANTIQFFDPGAGKRLAAKQTFSSRVTEAIFSPDGALLIVGMTNGQIRVLKAP
jgi:serine/threonine protein kinase